MLLLYIVGGMYLYAAEKSGDVQLVRERKPAWNPSAGFKALILGIYGGGIAVAVYSFSRLMFKVTYSRLRLYARVAIIWLLVLLVVWIVLVLTRRWQHASIHSLSFRQGGPQQNVRG